MKLIKRPAILLLSLTVAMPMSAAAQGYLSSSTNLPYSTVDDSEPAARSFVTRVRTSRSGSLAKGSSASTVAVASPIAMTAVTEEVTGLFAVKSFDGGVAADPMAAESFMPVIAAFAEPTDPAKLNTPSRRYIARARGGLGRAVNAP